ncbi:hypothetical protein LAZ67_8000866 [Cordylochernes scorpioides]|uniref:Transposase Tc1-like domain-containing protein n=1 Tax=Cordylochernes scorpioides TaxID=51811 RepID=A0ABY6KPR3_9ARAC|nr:hypothetical protein LAZ67_8000866 [Cordylochernes scorpioides]
MPRRKIRAHYEHMSEFETGLKEAGWFNRLIARNLCRSDAAIRRCCQKWVNNGSMQRQDGRGRPRETTEREDRAIVRMAVAAPESTLSTIQRVTGTQVSKMTINRRLRERNLRARRPLRCLPLTPVRRQVRLQWCRERSTWNCADWGPVSPDLSPIEHIWDVMGRRLQPSRNVDYLARQLETIWQEIPQHTIRNLYQSIIRRVAACIHASDVFTHRTVCPVPPTEVIITNEAGRVIKDTLPPVNEGDTIKLICRSKGGCLSIQMVRRWRSWFLEGRQNVHDDERSGRPVTATDNAAVAAVRNVVEADRRVTIDEIMIRLPPGIEIGRSSI